MNALRMFVDRDQFRLLLHFSDGACTDVFGRTARDIPPETDERLKALAGGELVLQSEIACSKSLLEARNYCSDWRNTSKTKFRGRINDRHEFLQLCLPRDVLSSDRTGWRTVKFGQVFCDDQ